MAIAHLRGKASQAWLSDQRKYLHGIVYASKMHAAHFDRYRRGKARDPQPHRPFRIT